MEILTLIKIIAGTLIVLAIFVIFCYKDLTEDRKIFNKLFK